MFSGLCLIAAFVMVVLAARPVPLTVQATFAVNWPDLPTAAPTVTKTVILYSYPTNTPDPAGSLDFCTGTPEPGPPCKVPYPTPPPPTPYPDCNDPSLTPGDWCVWPALTPTPE